MYRECIGELLKFSMCSGTTWLCDLSNVTEVKVWSSVKIKHTDIYIHTHFKKSVA